MFLACIYMFSVLSLRQMGVFSLCESMHIHWSAPKYYAIYLSFRKLGTCLSAMFSLKDSLHVVLRID